MCTTVVCTIGRTLWYNYVGKQILSLLDYTNVRSVYTAYGTKCWSGNFPRSDHLRIKGVLSQSRAELVAR